MLKREWEKLVNRVVWSWAGWITSWREEPSLQFWTYINVASAGLAFVLDLSALERAIILALGILILAAELMNTGIENAIDYISKDEHPMAKKAKDAASAAVALTALAALAAWVCVLVG